MGLSHLSESIEPIIEGYLGTEGEGVGSRINLDVVAVEGQSLVVNILGLCRRAEGNKNEQSKGRLVYHNTSCSMHGPVPKSVPGGRQVPHRIVIVARFATHRVEAAATSHLQVRSCDSLMKRMCVPYELGHTRPMNLPTPGGSGTTLFLFK